MILTDPYYLDNELLLKPFKNTLKVHYCPINPSVNFKELNEIINTLQPKHIISPYSTAQQEPTAASPIPGEEESKTARETEDNLAAAVTANNALSLTFPNCVLD